MFAPVVIITRHWPSTSRDIRLAGKVTFSSCSLSLSLSLSSFVAASDDELFLFFTVVRRYNAIVHPLRKRMTKQRAFVHIFIIWFGATLFAVPTLIFSRTLVVRLPHESLKDRTTERTICILKWPDGYPWQSRLDFT